MEHGNYKENTNYPEIDIEERSLVADLVRRAPPTKGDVYFIRTEGVDRVKIGKCGHRDVRRRLGGLQVGSSWTLEVMGVIPKGGMELESEIHKKFAAFWIRGEWFHLSDEIKRFIQTECIREE